MSVTFRVNGMQMTLTTDQVRRAVRGVDPEPLRTHAVDIDGRRFPMKQPFALATGLDRLDFTTNQARTQLMRLGFPVVRVTD